MSTDPPPFTSVEHVSAVISYAYTHQASDLHFEPSEHHFEIRMRRDGLLQTVFRGERLHAPRVNAQLKVMADLDIAEQRVPQDGRIHFSLAETHNLSIRVSTCPTIFGEKVVLRLLDPKAHVRSFTELGLDEEQRALLAKTIALPNGLILVTGPSGSGKTTTLYSALNSLNHSTRNIATIEDPVEITLPGINQVAVFPRINLSFARILRSLIRQDPDVLMIGEIRDRETAEIAIQAAQTGHLVLSTLHSASALEAINRLAHMGVPRYELISALRLVVAQRLLRTPTTGRTGVFEFLPITPAVRKYVLTEHYLSYPGLLQHEKITTLRAAALDLVSRKLVDLTEADRVVPED
jgi:type IV pilus assembly protein PilB